MRRINKRSRFLGFSLVAMVVVAGAEGFLLEEQRQQSSDMQEPKRTFVRLCGLPDLALCTEARYIRHRSLCDFFAPFSEDGALYDYFPSAFVYAPPPYLKGMP